MAIVFRKFIQNLVRAAVTEMAVSRMTGRPSKLSRVKWKWVIAAVVGVVAFAFFGMIALIVLLLSLIF